MTDHQLPRVTERELIHRGKKFDFERVNLSAPGAQPVWREVVRHPGAVCVLPVLRESTEDRIVMIRNHRFALGGTTGEQLWELPAGTCEPGEPVLTTAGRELIEETGFEAGTLESLLWFYTTPGMTDEKMHAVLATDLKPVGQQLEEDERIEVHVLPVSEVLAMVDRGEIVDAKTVLVVLHALRSGLIRSAEEGPA